MAFEDFRLKVFVSVAGSGGFSAAARELGVSQPAISQNIAELERLVGERLLTRGKNGVSLTRKGEVFLAHARAVLAAYDELEAACRIPESILLEDVTLDGERRNVLIYKGMFADLGVEGPVDADQTLDASGLALLPSFFNAAAVLDAEEADASLRKAALSGTTFLLSPDWSEDSLQAASEMGLRSGCVVDFVWEGCRDVQISRQLAALRREGTPLRMDLSMADSREVARLDSLGAFGQGTLVLHPAALDSRSIDLLLRRGVRIIVCPEEDAAFLTKLKDFPSSLPGRLVLGSPGLDMIQSMRFACLSCGGDVAVADIFALATKNGAEAFGLDAGSILKGKSADALLVDLGSCRLQPCRDFLKDFVLSADSSCVSHLLCGGRLVF